jgi:O-antigen/teichoic acid export membrane protein
VSLPDTVGTALEAGLDISRLARMKGAEAGITAQAEVENLVPDTGAFGFFTRGRLRTWGRLSVLSLVDQGLASGAGLGVNLLLARWMAAQVYGAFAVAFAGFLFVTGFYNVLLLEPMSVMGPSRYAGNLPSYFRAQIAVHAILVGALSGLSLLVGFALWRVVPASPLIGAVLGAGLSLPFLLLTWLSRRMCYVVQRPGLAIFGSAFYLGFVYVGLFALAKLAWLSSFSAFVLMGCGSLISSWLLLRRLGLWNYSVDGRPETFWSKVLVENVTYGKWLLGSTVMYSISTQAQMFLVAGMLGLDAAGILRAMQLPALVMTQVVTATGLLLLPSLSRDFGRGTIQALRRKAAVASVGLCGLACCFALFLALSAGSIEHLLFAGRYAAFARLMPILALVPAAAGLYLGFSMALRASRRPYFDLIANGSAALVGIVSAAVFLHLWGLPGAAASMVAGVVTLATVSFVCFSFCSWPSRGPASREVSCLERS